jgi:branched-chain amino acid transport system substrate-binding protein
MSIGWQDQAWRKGLWYSGKVARRRFLGLGVAAAGALGASMLVPAPWRQAFGAARPYKIGSLQPLTGAGAIAGRSALIGLEVAMHRINASGGINGRPIELVVRDDHSRTDTGHRAAEELVTKSRIDVHQGGFLSDVCLACMSIWERHKIVNMIGACLDTRITTTRCSRYSFRPFDYSPAQAAAFAPSLIKMGKRWHIIYSDYTWGQSTRDAYANEIRWRGGEIVGATAVPVGTADMRPFLQTIAGSFDGLLGIFFGQDGVLVATQAYDLGLTRKYRWAGDGAIATATSLPALGAKIEGFVGIDRYLPVFESTLDSPFHRKWFAEVIEVGKKFDPRGIKPDRFMQSNYEGMNFLRLGMQKSSFNGREDTPKLIAALEDMEVRIGDDFPQGDKKLRKEDHQAFTDEFIFEVRNGQHRILATVPWQQTLQQPACSFA